MKKLMIVLAIVSLAAGAYAADNVVGKDGSTLPISDNPVISGSRVPADVEYNTTGVIDGAATTGGSADGWASHFITSWTNNSGQDVVLVEFGWPCGGTGPVDWMVWMGAGLPGAPGSQNFTGLWTPVSSDDTTNPPTTYTYIDVTAANITVPAGATIFFGYENPGIGGQITYNGVETYGWYGGAWDPDGGWGRTDVLQLKANFAGVATESATMGSIKALFD